MGDRIASIWSEARRLLWAVLALVVFHQVVVVLVAVARQLEAGK